MAKMNQLNCAENTRNVGYGGCVPDIKLLKGAILYDSPREFTPQELIDLQTTLQNDAWSDNATLRAYPIKNFVALTDNSENPTIQTFDYGSAYVVRDGFYNWSAQFTDGGLCLSSALRTHNGKRWALFYDAERKLIGTKKGNNFAAIPLQYFYQNPMKLPTGSTTAAYIAQFSFDPKYFNEDVAFIKDDAVDASEIDGLQDLELVINSFNQTTGVANVTVQSYCGASNVYDTYNAILANIARWRANNGETGGDITLTTVAGVAGSKSFNVTLSTADADFPDDGTIKLKLAPPSVLKAAGILGYDSIAATLEVAGS